jgi:capsular polysaccharide biosynthesis protein
MISWNWDSSVVTPVSVEQMLSCGLTKAEREHGVRFVEEVINAGRYIRKRPFRIDLREIDPEHRGTIMSYLEQEIQAYGAIRQIKIKGASIIGQGAVVTSTNRLITDSVLEFLAAGCPPDGFDGRDNHQLSFSIKNGPRRVIDRPSILIKRPWYQNYGHWIVDGAAILAMISRMKLPRNVQLVVGRQNEPAMRRVVFDTINTVAPDFDVIEHPDDERWVFSDLRYISPVHVPPLMKQPTFMRRLRALMIGGHSTSRLKGIYVRRQKAYARELLNEEEVIAYCQQLGFAIVDPQALTLAQQVDIFNRASLVLGVKGAALTNCIFCSNGAHVIAMSPSDFPDPFFYDLVAQGNKNYSEVFGQVTSRASAQGRNPFKINIRILGMILEECCDEVAGRCQTTCEEGSIWSLN